MLMKEGSSMKYSKAFFLGCLLILLLTAPTVNARAGGGSSGSGGSASGSHHTSSQSNPVSNHPGATFITTIVAFGGFAYLSHYTKVYQIRKVKKSHRQAIKAIKKEMPYDIDGAVIDLYYTLQNAWKNQDMVIINQHLDPDLAQIWQNKLNWMTFNHQRNVMEQIHIINTYPFAVVNDHIFYYIHGIMVDYIEDTQTQQVIDGFKTPKPFIEFWEMELHPDHLTLYQIYQTDELSASDFNIQ